MRLGVMVRRAHCCVGLVVAVILTACSVTTPRNGVSVGLATSGGSGQPNAAAGPAGSGAGATVATDGPSAAGSAPAAGSAKAAATAAATRTPASAASGGGAASHGSTVGLTPDSITVSVMAGFSGTYGALFKTITEGGYGLWADEVNAAGGIYGRKVVVKEVDNADTAEGGVAACKEIEGNGSFLAINLAGLGGADMSSADCLDRAGIPVFASNMAGYRQSWRYIVSFFDDAAQGKSLAGYIKNVIGDHAGKVGMIVVNDPIHFAARDAVKAGLPNVGLSLVDEETVAAGQGSFVAELSRLRSAGATTVVILTGNEAIGIVRDAKAMGYAPNFTGVLWTLDEFSQAAGQLWTGIKAIRGWPTTDTPAFQAYATKAKQYHRDTLVNTTVMAVYGSGLLLTEILKKAGVSVTRDTVAPTAEQITGYNNGILALSFGPGVRVASLAMFPIVCCNTDNTWKGAGGPRLAF